MDSDTTITAFMVARDFMKLALPFAFSLGGAAFVLYLMGRWR